MLRMSLAHFIVAVIAVLAAAGCAVDGPVPTVVGDAGLTFFIRNHTDRTVLVYVDGVEVLRATAGEVLKDRLVILPFKPVYRVEARSATGHVFGSFNSNETGSMGAPGGAADVPGFVQNTRCGDVWVWLDHDISMEIAPLRPEDQPACE